MANYNDSSSGNNFSEEIIDLTNSAYEIFQSFVSTNRFKGSYDRLAANRLMYAGINNGQWPTDVIEKMTEAGYPIHTINFVQGMVDTTLGHLNQSPIDIAMKSCRPEDKEEVNIMQTLYDIDDSNGSWDAKFSQFMLDGLIHSGWIQLLPETTSDVRGNVGMETCDPAHMFPDPYWISGDIKDCRRLFKASWLTPQQIKVIYKTKNEAIENAIASFSHYNQENPQLISTLFDRSVEYYDQEGDRYKVVEYHYLEDEIVPVIIDTYTGEEAKMDLFPDHVADMKKAPLKAWLKLNGGDRFEAYEKKVQHSKFLTFCPALGLDFNLEAGNYPYQVGHLPFFRWSYHNVYGEPLGLVDLLTDLQQILNKRESQITKILNMKTAGNWAIESDAFGGDTQRIKDFQRRSNMTGQTFVLEPGSNSQNKIKPLFDNSPINDLRQQTQSLVEYMSRVSNVTPASQGSAQPKQDGSLAFEQAQAQSFTVMETLVSSFKEFKKLFAKAYVKSAIEQYGEDPRTLYDTYSEKNVSLNVINYDGVANEVTTSNTLQDAKWYQVGIEMKRMGDSVKRQKINSYSIMLNSMSSPAARTVLEHEILKLMDLPDQATKMLNASLELQYQASMKQVESQGMQADAASAQSEMMIQQSAQPQGEPQQGPNPQAPSGGMQGNNGQGGLNQEALLNRKGEL